MNEAIRERRRALQGAIQGRIDPAQFSEIMKRTAADLDKAELLNELKFARGFASRAVQIAGLSIDADISALDALVEA